MNRTRVLIAGAAGRDFHNFNLVYRGREEFEVVGFTATQIPNIDGRVYPAELAAQAVQRFEHYEDLDAADATIEEREEYEPHLAEGNLVFAGIDYAAILSRAEEEADVVVWDGGNNDTPFIRPDLHVVVVDPHRPGHELRYHPGETNLRMADVCVVNKTDTAPPQPSPSSGPGPTPAGSSSSTSRRCGSPTGSRSSASRRSDPCWPTGGSSRRPRRSPDVALLTVVALGGNALLRPGQRGTAAEHRANLAATFRAIAPLLAGEVVLTHGNGPQVGNELLRQELAAAEAPPLPLWVAVAQTQAEIGTLAAAELRPVVGRPVAVVATHVVVAEDDPAFDHPTKPIGPFYDSGHAQALQSDRGWMLREDAGRGWRRVVASPKPLEVLELDAVRLLLEAGSVVVAAGGGGIPVVVRDGRYDG